MHNPLLTQLLRKAGTPPLWLTAIFTVLLFAWTTASMLPGLDKMQAEGTTNPDNLTWLSIAALLVLMGSPVMVGVNAAVFTGRHSEPGNLKKLKLSKISRADKLWGYALSALYRMRIALALEIGLAPALAIGITEIMFAYYKVLREICMTGGNCVGIAADPAFDAGRWMLIDGLMVGGVVGFTVLAAALGSWAALTWKGQVIAPAVVVAVMAALTGLFVMQIGPTQMPSLPVAIAMGVGPYALAVAILWLGGSSG